MENLNQPTTGQTNVQPQYSPPPPQALSRGTGKPRTLRGRLEYMGCGLLIYMFIVLGIQMTDMIFHIVYFFVLSYSGKADYDELFAEYQVTVYDNAVPMIVGVIIGIAAMILYFIKAMPVKQVFERHKKMTFPKLIMLISVLMGCQLIFLFLDEGVEKLLNLVGLSLQTAIESSQAGSNTISMFLYAGFIGPIAEEIIYRGFVMHTFEKADCGKVCSILVSALLFGVMHANPTQSVFALYVGLVFAYTAMEYGIIWSIALHIINNFLFGDVLTFIINKLPETAGNILGYTVFIITFIAGLIVLIAKRKFIISFIRENRTPEKTYGTIFTCISILIFIFFNLVMAVLQVRPLK